MSKKFQTTNTARTSGKSTSGKNEQPRAVASAPAPSSDQPIDKVMDSVQSTPSTPVATSESGVKTMANSITLVKRNTEKSGNVAYSMNGVRASLYFNRGLFSNGDNKLAPHSVVITALDAAGNELEPTAIFAQPGQITSPIAKMTLAERLANLARAREIRKNETPAQKAARLQAQAAKLTARAAKLAAQAATATPVEQPEPVTA